MTKVPQILVRSKDRVELFPVPDPLSSDCPSIVSSPNNSVVLCENANCPFHTFSSDGQYCLIIRPSVGLCFLNMNSSHEELQKSMTVPYLTKDNGVAIKPALAYFSPLGSYIVTWERPVSNKNSESPPANNFKIWKEQTCIFERFVKQIPKVLSKPSPNGGSLTGGEAYTALQFTHDEAFVCFLVSNEIQFYYLGEEKLSITGRLKCMDISSFSLPPPNLKDPSIKLKNYDCLSNYMISTFVPEKKGKPARVSFHSISFTESSLELSEKNLCQKSFFQTEYAQIKWSPHGNAALILSQTTVDTSGESYYGSSSLHLFTTHPTTPEILQVSLIGKGGSVVHDVQWSPCKSNQTPMFALISGKMPAMGSLHFGTTGDASFLFGEAHRNSISWSPHGRFVCLAGFGNLAGGIDFWDRYKLKKMPRYHYNDTKAIPEDEIRAHCAVGYGWSPDSRTFFVSTTSPRMNVDNAIRIYKYNGYGPFDQYGKAVAWQNEKYQPNLLHTVEFVPSMKVNDTEDYSDRPQSPPPKARNNGDFADKNPIRPSTSLSSNNSKAATPVGRYVPPSARGSAGKSSGGSLAERMRRDREGSTAQAGKVTRSLSAAFVGNAKKLPVGMAPPEPNTKSKNAIRREKQRLNKQKKQKELEEEEKRIKEEAAKKPEQTVEKVDPAKRAKKITKLLKQIDTLKTKSKEELNDDQLKKLETEENLRKELASLNL